MVKQGRTSDAEIQEKIQNIRGVINGTFEPPDGQTRGQFLDKWFWELRRFADDLEARPDYNTPEGDLSVTTWPEKLRAVADECDRSAEVFSTPRAELTQEERLYPSLPQAATTKTGGRLDERPLAERLYPGLASGE